MNSDFVLVRGSFAVGGFSFWAGGNSWTNSVQEAKRIYTRVGAERIIARRQAKGQWAKVGYMTVEDITEQAK